MQEQLIERDETDKMERWAILCGELAEMQAQDQEVCTMYGHVWAEIKPAQVICTRCGVRQQ